METPAALNVRIVEKPLSHWENKHFNFRHPAEGLYDVWNPKADGAGLLAGYRATTAALQRLVAQALQDGRRIRALGSGWSISPVAATDGRLVNTQPLNWIFRITEGSVAPGYGGAPEDLVFVQCGTSVLELNAYLAQRGRSLKASGASNGQTFVGAMSTGTHGAAFDVGAVQDAVVGLHLLAGPTRSLWLERASRPVTADGFAEKLGAELVRDDRLFNAALVSFGSFGILHGALIETEPVFLLEAHRLRLPLDDALWHTMCTLDFGALPLPHPGERPYHFEVVVNPYDLPGGAYVTTMYRRPYRDDYQRPQPSADGLGPGDDVLHVIGTIADRLPNVIPTLMSTLFGQLYNTYDRKTGTLGEMFANSRIRGKSTGSALGVPLERAREAMELALALNRSHGPFAGVFAFRYVKRSDALLAFTRYDVTAVLDLDGAQAEGTTRFFRQAWRAFDDAGIPYTLHWGKVNELDEQRVRRMYGDDREAWLASRGALLEPDARLAFSSPFLDRAGLSGPPLPPLHA